MKIYIRLSDGRNFAIPAPIGVVKAFLSLGSFGISIARPFVPEEHRQYIDCVDIKELRKGMDTLKRYKGLNFIDVKTQDGTEVKVII